MFKKTKIAAVTAAVLGVSAMANAATTNVTLAENGASGQVLVFPYYNVNNGFSTSFNITNTKDEFKVIKIRFRESNTSNDVLDFNVYMSPYDVFTMGLTKTASGGVLMQTTDTTCTHPAIPAGGKEFIGADVYDSVTKADVREGYLEVIEMGIIDPTDGDKAKNSKGKNVVIASTSGIEHVNGVPGDCAVIKNAWKDNVFTQGGAKANSDWTNPSAPTGVTYNAGFYGSAAVEVLKAPTGGLVGSSILIDTVNIAGFVAEPVTVDGYSSKAQHYLPSDTSFYLLPSLASGSTATVAALSDDGTAMVSNTWATVARDFGLDDTNLAPNNSVPSGINPMPVANAMLVTSLSNQYFIAGETSTDWVVSAPMRKHAIFNDYQYSTGSASTGSKDIKIDSNHYWKYLKNNNDVQAKFNYFDREEQFSTPEEGDFSPPIQGQTVKVPFYREVNILALTSGGANPSVLGSDNAQTVTMDSGFVLGWGMFNFTDTNLDLTDSRYASQWVTKTGTMGTTGVPFAGFASARGTVNGQNLGETFPMSVTRVRGMLLSN